MNITNRIILFVTLVICVTVLSINIYSGAIDSFLLPILLVSIICMPIFIIVSIFALIVLGRRGILTKIAVPWKLIQAIAGILLVSYIMLKLYIPRRLAFMVSQSAFEQIIVDEKLTPNRQFSFYKVEKNTIDAGGNKYFYISSRGEGIIGIDVVSYGFTYQPNRNESSVTSSYQLFHLYGNWNWFRVSKNF